MNISVVQSARSTGTVGTETRRIRDVEDQLQQLEPNEGPLTTILSRLGVETATDVKLEWFEDQLLPDFDTLGAALTAAATTMTVTNYKYFRSGDIVIINDKEQVRVSATPTSTTVSITRAYGSESATAAASGSRLFIVSDASDEFSTYRDFLSTQKVPKYNYIQDLRTPMAFSNAEIATGTFAGKDIMQERAKMLIEHKKKMEKALINGQPYEDTSGTYPIHTTGGVLYFISTNVKDVAGGFTEPEFEDFLRLCFRYGSSEKLVLCSPKAIQSINGFHRSKLQTHSDESTYGVTMTRYQNAGRVVMLAEEKLLTNNSLTDLTGIAGYAILLDMPDLKLAYLEGNGTKLWQNIQNPGVSGEVDEYRTSFGLKMFLEQCHGLITGIVD